MLIELLGSFANFKRRNQWMAMVSNERE